MSGGSKRKTTAQHLFGRWMRIESTIKNIDAILKDLESLNKNKIIDQLEKIEVNDAIILLSIGRTCIRHSLNKLKLT